MPNIKFGTSQLLILLSAFMYSQNFWFSIIMFSIGLLAATIDYSIKWNIEQEKTKKSKEAVDKVEENLKNIFSMALKDNNEITH